MSKIKSSECGTLYLQMRKSRLDPWGTLNQLNFSDDLSYLAAHHELSQRKFHWNQKPEYINYLFRLTDNPRASTPSDCSWDETYGEPIVHSIS